MSDDALLDEARKAVKDNDLAAWERVRALMMRRGAIHDESVEIERAKFAERFLEDLERVRASVLSSPRSSVVDRIHGQPVADEADLIECMLDESSSGRTERGGDFFYLRPADIALVLNRTFGITGWSFKIDSIRFLDPPHHVNSVGRPQSDGVLWNASVVVVATLTVRGPGGRVAERQDAGTGCSVSGRAPTRSDAVRGAINSALSCVFRQCAKFLGPATGMKLSEGDIERLRQDIQRLRETGVST